VKYILVRILEDFTRPLELASSAFAVAFGLPPKDANEACRDFVSTIEAAQSCFSCRMAALSVSDSDVIASEALMFFESVLFLPLALD
jgi:hypothetical protein